MLSQVFSNIATGGVHVLVFAETNCALSVCNTRRLHLFWHKTIFTENGNHNNIVIISYNDTAIYT